MRPFSGGNAARSGLVTDDAFERVGRGARDGRRDTQLVEQRHRGVHLVRPPLGMRERAVDDALDEPRVGLVESAPDIGPQPVLGEPRIGDVGAGWGVVIWVLMLSSSA